MKKLLSMLTVLALCISLSACGSSETGGPSTQGNGASAAPSETSQAPGENEGNGQENATSKGQIVFDGMTAVDNDECSISITEIDPDNMWGYTLKVNLENKSAEKTYMFSVLTAAVNGLQCDPFFASEVAPGKKSVDSISFTNGELEENEIDFTDIELTFRVYDSDDWMADEVAVETVHVYPYGEGKAEVFERAPQSSDNVIIDNEYVTATVIGYEEDDIWGYTVNLFLQNKSEKEVTFGVDEASVNGYMADPFWAASVLPGKCAFSSMSWFDSDL